MVAVVVVVVGVVVVMVVVVIMKLVAKVMVAVCNLKQLFSLRSCFFIAFPFSYSSDLSCLVTLSAW